MDNTIEKLREQAKKLSYQGLSKEQISTNLGVSKLDVKQTKYVLDAIDEAQIDIELKQQRKDVAINKMLFGGFLFVFGVVITSVFFHSNRVVFYIMIGMILGGPVLVYNGYKSYKNPISEELSVKQKKIKKSKFNKWWIGVELYSIHIVIT